MEIQEAYKQKLAAQLNEWSAQLNLLEARAKNLGADMRVKHAEELHELRGKLHGASEKIREMETSSGEAWMEVKAAADKIRGGPIWLDRISQNLSDTPCDSAYAALG